MQPETKNANEQDTINLQPSQLVPVKIQRSKRRRILIGILVALVVTSITLGTYKYKHPNFLQGKDITGSSECVAWAKKIAGANFNGIHTLKCTLGASQKISNSTITVKHLEYTGEPVNESDCKYVDQLHGVVDGISIPGGIPEDVKYCIGWTGIVASSGKYYAGVDPSQQLLPTSYDYCYDSNFYYQKTKPQPTIHDLYLYKGDVYVRDVFNNVSYQTPFGQCLFNGTSLYGKGYITNVKVTYSNFPTDCARVSIGHTNDEYLGCISLATSEYANLDNCNSDEAPLENNNFVIYKVISGVHIVNKDGSSNKYINGSCVQAYLERLASLNQCSQINDNAGLLAKCQSYIAHPGQGITRVTMPI